MLFNVHCLLKGKLMSAKYTRFDPEAGAMHTRKNAYSLFSGVLYKDISLH